MPIGEVPEMQMEQVLHGKYLMLTYLIASDDNGFICSKRMAGRSLTDADAHAFAQKLFPLAKIYGQLERCSSHTRIVRFYQSGNKQEWDGVVATGSLWP
jgi:hypothetical protein